MAETSFDSESDAERVAVAVMDAVWVGGDRDGDRPLLVRVRLIDLVPVLSFVRDIRDEEIVFVSEADCEKDSVVSDVKDPLAVVSIDHVRDALLEADF